MLSNQPKIDLSAPYNPYDEKELEDFITDLSSKLIKQIMNRPTSHNQAVVDFKNPEEIKDIVELTIEEKGTTLQNLRSQIDTVMDLSVNTSHPHFFNQLFAQADPVATVGEWVTAVMNASMYTYEVSPCLTVMEKEVLSMMEQYIGFNVDSEVKGNGILCPGGSISNLLALNTARYWKFPQVKEEGMQAIPKIAFFVSKLAHYSILKGCHTLGIGSKNLFQIECNDKGQMLISELEKSIEKAKADGYTPICITATAGTTVFGAYDDIEECSRLCKKYDMWLHIDGAWGGSIVLTSDYKNHMKGIEKADSITWNPHKLMGIPQQCSAMILNGAHKTLLKECHSSEATYLFQKDKANAEYDTGDTTIQCGRRNDILKLWMMWKTIGLQGMTHRVDHVWGISRYLADAIRARPDKFIMVNDPMCTNVCFYYVPPCLEGMGYTEKPYSEWTAEMKEKINVVCPKIKKMMQERGSMMCTYQAQDELVNFWRMVLISPCLSSKDMDFVLDEIEECGNTLDL
jgi:glutamate/tyrosine decarboxylase-like PLP-dependent enzyme